MPSNINNEDLKELTIEDIDGGFEGYKVVSNHFVESRRWVDSYVLVWQEADKYYAYQYEVPSTEMQEGSEADIDVSNIYEVKPVEVTTVRYEKV